ncbi:MAG: phosphoenolpyruvate--protein phosphotransferase [Alphaproteobacteria bacterium]
MTGSVDDKPATGPARAGTSHGLLRELNGVMAETGDPAEALGNIVRLIAANMGAEVCSIYLMQPDNLLELFATEGLNQDAIHQTRLKLGQGLIGVIAATARPLNLAEAQNHPQFAYRPETGEEAFHSFLGVPIVRNGKVAGVLAVQSRTPRHYSDDEIVALQTIATVLSGIVGSGQLVRLRGVHDSDLKRDVAQRYDVIGLADGIAVGHAKLHDPRIVVETLVGDDAQVERERLTNAMGDLRQSIDRMLDSADVSLAGEHRDVLEAYRMFANDNGWTRRIMQAIDGGLSAEAAVQQVQAESRARLQHQTDAYLRERLHDLDDLSNRLMRHLMGLASDIGGKTADLQDDTILFARSMGPAELLDYDRSKLRGIVLAEGSPTSHVAIVARALDVPLVGRATEAINSVEDGDLVIVDADTNVLFVRPQSDVADQYREGVKARAARQAVYDAARDEPAVTKDGTRINLNMNAGLVSDLETFKRIGADGIGLFRTELQFMVSSQLPRTSTQIALYKQVIEASQDKPVIFRTIDVGGDKVLPYLDNTREENPALGWRAIRVALDRPALLRYQVRALLEAANGGPMSFMFPMVADVSEFQAARRVVDRELERLDKLGKPRPSELKVGTMLEVPSLAWQLGTLLPLTDFVSVGSNDLMQFFFASDRGNPKLANRYDLLSPSVLSFLNFLVNACNTMNVPISLCGEMAGKPLEALALIGLGFRSISMPPASIGPVKQMVKTLDLAALEQFIITLFEMPDHSVRGNLETYARDHGILI